MIRQQKISSFFATRTWKIILSHKLRLEASSKWSNKKTALKSALFDENIVMKINHFVRCFCYHCEMPVKTNVSATESRCVKGRFNKRRTSKLQASPSFFGALWAFKERKLQTMTWTELPKRRCSGLREKAHTENMERWITNHCVDKRNTY